MLPKFVKKSWGWELWHTNVKENGADYCGKILYVEHNKWSSNFNFHYHKKKIETFCVLEGYLHLDYIDSNNHLRTIVIDPYKTFTVPPLMKHRFTSVTQTGCKFLETSTFHSDDDSYRCSWNAKEKRWDEV